MCFFFSFFLFFYMICKCHSVDSCIDLFMHVCCLILIRYQYQYQDNATANMSAQALVAVQNAGFELLRHPPCSPFVSALHGKWVA